MFVIFFTKPYSPHGSIQPATHIIAFTINMHNLLYNINSLLFLYNF
jgi:hypothetical protein